MKYRNIEGHRKSTHFSQGMSELLQHEIDHLDGILAIDRIRSTKDIMCVSEYQKKFGNHYM